MQTSRCTGCAACTSDHSSCKQQQQIRIPVFHTSVVSVTYTCSDSWNSTGIVIPVITAMRQGSWGSRKRGGHTTYYLTEISTDSRGIHLLPLRARNYGCWPSSFNNFVNPSNKHSKKLMPTKCLGENLHNVHGACTLQGKVKDIYESSNML